MQDDPPPSTPVRGARWLYTASAIFSIICLVIIAVIWCHVYYAPYEPLAKETPMLSQRDIDQYFAKHVADTDSDKSIYIPTGVIIQSVEFNGPYTIKVSG